jgi:hypothetical protein
MRLPFVVALLASTALPAATVAVALPLAFDSWINCTHGPGTVTDYALLPTDSAPPWSYYPVSMLDLYDTTYDSYYGYGHYHDYAYLTEDGYFRDDRARP